MHIVTVSNIISSIEAVIGTEDSVSITCNHGPGGLVDLDWFLTSVNGPEDGTEITIDGVKYEGETPSIEINDISASDEGLYRCKYELQLARKGATVMGESEGQCLYVLGESHRFSLNPKGWRRPHLQLLLFYYQDKQRGWQSAFSTCQKECCNYTTRVHVCK